MLLYLRNHRIRRFIALSVLFTFIGQILLPTTALALTAGPSSPEFSSFEPVATTDMVNLFSGDFNYNLPVLEIPGPDGGGYALSLSYHSGASSEEESSWVGNGWTLNPGCINRSTRGFPDDYRDVKVLQYNKTRPNWSASITNSLGLEIFSKDKKKEFKSSIGEISASTSLRFNNYQGFARTYGFGIGVMGLANLNMNVGAQGPTFSAGINFAGFSQRAMGEHKQSMKANKEKFDKVFDLNDYLKSAGMKMISKAGGSLYSTYGVYSFSEATQTAGIVKMDQGLSQAVNYSMGLVVNPLSAPIGIQAGFYGNYNRQSSAPQTDAQVSGYQYNPDQSKYGAGTLSDYTVEKGNPFQKRDLYLGIPFNNADHYMVAGEGLSGSFRFYSKKTGHYYPNFIENKSSIVQAGFDLAIGGGIGVGYNFGVGSQLSKVSDWPLRGQAKEVQFVLPPAAKDATPAQKAQEAQAVADMGAFRFAQDMGGSVSYAGSNLKAAELHPLLNQPLLDGVVNKEVDKQKFSHSSYIAYHRAKELKDNSAIWFNKSVNQIEIQRDLADVDRKNDERIVELSVFNADGMQYSYGVPVYTRNETNLSLSVNEAPQDKYLVYPGPATPLQKVGKKYSVDPVKLDASNSDYHTIRGEVRPEPYANAYLLTQILTPDYVDRTGNGIDEADFGGWTQFHYHKRYGTDNMDWYRWRTPYNGLLYNKNQISDTKDDMGNLMTGEKEVYYLKAVETKTHIAYFVTNKSQKNRFTQGLVDQTAEAIPDSYLQGSMSLTNAERGDGRGAELLADTPESKGNQTLEHLEKIVLFSKQRPEKPLKIIRFAYDYSLVQNLPNHVNGKYPANKTSAESGKLTLKRVWFEYEGVVNTKISPYEFTYTYKPSSAFAPQVRSHYPDETSVGDRYTVEAQNPDYAPHLLDPWGNIQQYGKERRKHLIPWIYQGPAVTSVDVQTTSPIGRSWRQEVVPGSATAENFDPAAWQLKQIHLPSGGEILVHYEQKDYAYVQDRLPMTMASLVAVDQEMDADNKKYNLTPTYTVNARDLGFSPNDPDALYQSQVDSLRAYFSKERIYFKYLYSLRDTLSGSSLSGIDNCQSEYITGYASVDWEKSAEGLNDGIKVVEVNGEKHFQIRLRGLTSKDERQKNTSYEAVPRQACYDFYTTQRMGKWENGCVSDMEDKFDWVAKRNDNLLFIHASEVVLEMQKRLLQVDRYDIPAKSKVGKHLNLPLSFLRLPMIKAKKGGGVRVKRLLMYDPGIENGDAALYGQEYLYQDFKEIDGKLQVISSGVATNEPTEAREESPLVGFMPRKQQSWYSRITAGDDKEQTEGPLGESVLPGAAVGHSRVVVRNIHTGATGTGFTVQEFYTVKDYPFDGIYKAGPEGTFDYEGTITGVSHTSLSGPRHRKDILIIPAGLFFYERNHVWATQAYRFIINSMHGLTRRVASYAGDYTITKETMDSQFELDSFTRISEQQYEYFKPGEKIKMLQPDGTYVLDLPGKEMDVAMEMKRVTDVTKDLSIEIDITIGVAPIIPVVVAAGLSFELSDKGIGTHVISKVIQYPAIVKKVTAFQDGVTSITENLAFNPHTGQAVLTRTEDGYHGIPIHQDNALSSVAQHEGSVYSLQLPASWYYPELGPKYQQGVLNETRTNQLSAVSGQVISYGAKGNPLRTGTVTGSSQAKTWATDPIQGVVDASAQTFKKDWFNFGVNTVQSPVQKLVADQFAINYSSTATSQEARNALQSKWRPWAQYVYRADVLSANAAGRTIYSAGMLPDNGFTFFTSWNGSESSAAWVKATEVELYSPHGNALQEKNALSIYSTAQYGDNRLPTMIASNARYGSVGFENFEYTGNHTGPAQAHSGRGAYALEAGKQLTVLQNLLISQELANKGGLIKLWVHSPGEQTSFQVAVHSAILNTTLSAPLLIAQTGAWRLYQVAVPASALSSVGTSFELRIENGPEPLLIDDVRFQPLEAQATCYVYDTQTLRLVTQFDDQHFGLYYQYNDEGKLVRKLIETERGLKTVQETQYNLPTVPR
jgi:hypothetical protein